MPDPLSGINLRETRQMDQARPDQIQNHDGAYVFPVTDWTRALRFLILGTDGGSYYASERALTRENATVILRLADTEGEKLVNLLLEVSDAGRAPRQNQTLFSLAACFASADPVTRAAAARALPFICRTGTHLFLFAGYIEQFRGWGRGLRRAVGAWYDRQDPMALSLEERELVDRRRVFAPADNLAYQAVKYRQREGWTHDDLLRLAHPRISDPAIRSVAAWITGNTTGTEAYTTRDGRRVPERPNRFPIGDVPRIIEGYERAQKATSDHEWASLVTEYHLPWEALPDAALNKPLVQEALLPDMGITALIRQLNRLTKLGLIAPLGGKTKEIAAMLTDAEKIKRGRVHPLQVLTALVTYSSGRGFQGGDTWTPVPKIIEALNETFYLAFGAIEPSGKRTLLGLDVSGSMSTTRIAKSPLYPYQASAALAMSAIRTEEEVYPMAFSSGFVALPLTAQQRLDDVLHYMNGNMPFERTDCSVPMQWASRNKVPVDTFIIYTDSETNSFNSVHPFQALKRYRDIMGIGAKLVVVGMTSNGFTVADPSDAGMLDVVGMDTATPNIISAFARGEV